MTLSERIHALLRQVGPTTPAELAAALETPQYKVEWTLWNLRKRERAGKVGDKWEARGEPYKAWARI